MLIYAMGISVDGFIADRNGDFNWSEPSEEQFDFHLEQTRSLGAHLCGRKLYDAMQVWETDPAMRNDEASAAFADVWTALPKIVFSRALTRVDGNNARLATRPLADEIAAALDEFGEIAIGGADLGAQAVSLGLVDELHLFRNPVLVGGGTPLLPPVTTDVPLELLETRTFGSRVLYERYRRVRSSPDQ